jgi:hypothetical protein
VKRRRPEDEFQSTIIDTALTFGWLVFHVSDSRREVIDRRRGVSFLVGDELAKGWPDLSFAHPRWRRFAVRELKSDVGRVTPEQRRWLETLTLCGVDAGVWRPRDWDELIVPFLTRPTYRREPLEASA